MRRIVNILFLCVFCTSCNFAIHVCVPYRDLFCLCYYYCLNEVVDNIYIIFGIKLYRQIVGIPIGTNCAPLAADFILYFATK